MYRFLNHSRARTIAEGQWGTGGTQSYPTNRRGCFYFSCSGHGGFVIDAAALTPEERAGFDLHLTMETGTAFCDGAKVKKVHHSLKMTRTRYKFAWSQHPVGFYLAEEDCAWCIPAVFAGILAGGCSTKTPEEQVDGAKRTFNSWYVQKRTA